MYGDQTDVFFGKISLCLTGHLHAIARMFLFFIYLFFYEEMLWLRVAKKNTKGKMLFPYFMFGY